MKNSHQSVAYGYSMEGVDSNRITLYM